MANCGGNTLLTAKVTSNDANMLSSGLCQDDGPIPCPRNIGPRRNREKVRQSLKDYVKLRLGAPVLRLELDEQQLDLAVDEALDIYAEYAPRDFFDYFVFNTISGRSVYQMPPDVGLVRNVFYRTQPRSAFSDITDLGGVVPLEYFYIGGAYEGSSSGIVSPLQPVWGNMGEWTLFKMYQQSYTRLSSMIGGWEWLDHDKIKIYPTPQGNETVVVHYLQACKDWKQSNMAMREGALCISMIMLGEIRSKFQGTYGPTNSGMQLNGADMVQRGQAAMDKWLERLTTMYGDIPPITMD